MAKAQSNNQSPNDQLARSNTRVDQVETNCGIKLEPPVGGLSLTPNASGPKTPTQTLGIGRDAQGAVNGAQAEGA
jgi:hypothetical protein